MDTPPTGDEDEEWECPACDLKEHPEHAHQNSRVNWRPSWEPEEGLRENEDVARMVDTWNEDNKFNPARMTIRERQTPHKHAATGHATDPQWEHIWHTSETPSNSTRRKPADVKALGACCVVVRNVDLWAPPPHPAAVDVRAAPPTVTTRAACVYSSDGARGHLI
jgi:hypothetical protein